MATVDQTSIRGFKLPHECVSSQAYLGLGFERQRVAGSESQRGLPEPSALSRPQQAGSGDAYGTEGLTSWPIAHINPDSSRAIAVTTTVGFLPRASSFR